MTLHELLTANRAEMRWQATKDTVKWMALVLGAFLLGLLLIPLVLPWA